MTLFLVNCMGDSGTSQPQSRTTEGGQSAQNGKGNFDGETKPNADAGETPHPDEAMDTDLIFDDGGSADRFSALAKQEGLSKETKEALLEASKLSVNMAAMEDQISVIQTQLREAKEFAELIGSPDEPGPGADDFVNEVVTRQKKEAASKVDTNEYNRILEEDGVHAAERYRLDKEVQAKEGRISDMEKRLQKLETEKRALDAQRQAEAARDSYKQYVTGLCKKAKLTASETDSVMIEAAGKAALTGQNPDVKEIIIAKIHGRGSLTQHMKDAARTTEQDATKGGRPSQPAGTGTPAGTNPKLPEVTAKDYRDGFGSWAARAAETLRSGIGK